MTTQKKYGDDFKVGDVFRTQALTVTETHVVNWAGLTGDFYPLHMDQEYAARSQFGERLAHGPLIFGLAVGLVAMAGFAEDAAIAWLGVDGMRMLAPVRIGDTVRVEVRVKETRVTRDPKKGIQVWVYSVLNQRDEPVLVFDFQLMFHLRGPGSE
jgi:acyl dehydratase